jgi:hypothetical protein
MGEKIKVVGHFKYDFGKKLESLTLKKGDVELKLGSDDWNEIIETMNSKKRYAETYESENDYTPSEIFVWNTENGE